MDDLRLQDFWFLQNGATAYTARATNDSLEEAFLCKFITRFGDLLRPARSPDLTVLDFFI